MTLSPSFASNFLDRPAFASLEAFRAYAAEGFRDFPGACSIRYNIALGGVAMTVDACRDGRVLFVSAT
jgi:hypothetical protein